ncbi:hypothetical protein HMPREF9999_00644 [Alloprevotella sp. oral taxon 473 str. F0040]|nr:hypothetical protein HMPREF9999_00644 [Alloprevotella sp. oral taxon 473 str. F0040]
MEQKNFSLVTPLPQFGIAHPPLSTLLLGCFARPPYYIWVDKEGK